MLTITATDLPRYLACKGSPFLDSFTPDFQDDEARDEGNAAHWLTQQVHSGKFTALELVERKAYNGYIISAEMVDYLEPYIAAIGCGGLVEYETSFKCPNGTWQINSRADHVHYADGVLTIKDLKYGWRLVEVEQNWTLLAHAFGFISNNPDKPVHTIVFEIYQPRPLHPDGTIRRWTISEVELRTYYATLVDSMNNPDMNLHTGEHCKGCPKITNCPAYQAAMFNALEATQIAFNSSLNNNDLAYLNDVLKRAQTIIDTGLKAYEELTLHRVRKGEIVPNYSIETGLSNRALKEYVTPEVLAAMTGRTDLVKHVPLSPKQLEVKGVPKELVAALTERKEKAPKLVRISANKKAEKLFN